MAALCQLSLTPVFDDNARPSIGATLTFYDAGTLTPRTVYKDSGVSIPWLQPIPVDASSRVPVIFTQGLPYRVRIVAPNGNLLADIDGIPGDVASGGGGGGGGGGTGLITGDMQWNYGTAIIAGRVRANGRTIGNATSGATERANSDTGNLFTWLWNADPNLPVSGGRGVSAAADFAASKTIVLPDFNGRTPFGIDGMGSTPSGRLAGATFGSGNATTLGSTLGTAVETLTTTQIPSHTHTGTTQANSAFSLSGTTASAGGHTHTATTGNESASHTHSGTTGSQNAGHTHSGTTSTDPGHTHTGGTDVQGAHNHNTTLPQVSTTSALASSGGVGGYWNGASGTATTDTQGAHAHTLSINTAGSHAHNFTSGTESANHQHAFTSGTESANHTHAVTVVAVGDHAHAFTTNAGGVHTHAFTSNATGGGGAHNNVPPGLLVTFYVVL